MNTKHLLRRLGRLGRKNETSALPFILLGVGIGVAGAAWLAMNPKARSEAQRLARRVGDLAQDKLLSARSDDRSDRGRGAQASPEMSDSPNGIASYRDQEMSFGS